MKDVTKPEIREIKNKNSNEEIAEKLGKPRAKTFKIASETLKKYF